MPKKSIDIQQADRETDSYSLMRKYIYCWKNNPKRLMLFNRECQVITRGSMNSALVEFENGQREIISRNALKKHEPRAGWIRDSLGGKYVAILEMVFRGWHWLVYCGCYFPHLVWFSCMETRRIIPQIYQQGIVCTCVISNLYGYKHGSPRVSIPPLSILLVINSFPF